MVNHFLGDILFSVKDYVDQHIALGPASVNERGPMVVQILSSVEKELYGILSGHTVRDDGPLDVSYLILFCDVLRLSWIDAAPDRDSPFMRRLMKFNLQALCVSRRIPRLCPDLRLNIQ